LRPFSGLLPKATPIEIWFHDKMYLRQKNGFVRQWARKGSRPRQPKGQRNQSAYLVGAVVPAQAKGAAIVMPKAKANAMWPLREEIAHTAALDAHAAVLLDQAG